MPDADDGSVRFLARAAGEFLRGGWVFTGFHWPVLAGQVAARVDPGACRQLLEAGATVGAPAPVIPTSTTDFAAFGDALEWLGGSDAVLPTLARRADRVVLDAANVDLHGALNATAIGDYSRPLVRLPGGGGAVDAAAAAKELVLLHGGTNPQRIARRVEHVTAAPGAGAVVRLVCRWGTLRLDGRPRLVEVARGSDGCQQALAHLATLGVAGADGGGASVADAPAPAPETEAVAEQVLAEAAARGYAVAARFRPICRTDKND